MDFLLVLGILVAAGVGWVWVQISDSNRDQELEALARRLGMSFRFGLPQELKDLLHRFRVMEKARENGGDFQAGINSISGTWRDRKIVFFDYQWMTVHRYGLRNRWRWAWDDQYGYGEYRRTHRRSAVAVQLGVALQPVLIRPERLVDKALALVGYEDIDFDHLPEFSSKFYVNSPDGAAARRLVTAPLARFFTDHIRCTVDIVGPWMLMHVDGTIRASRVRQWFDIGGRLSELITREQGLSR